MASGDPGLFTKDFTDLLSNRIKPIDKFSRLIMTINIPAG